MKQGAAQAFVGSQVQFLAAMVSMTLPLGSNALLVDRVERGRRWAAKRLRRRRGTSKYKPHQGRAECARRRRRDAAIDIMRPPRRGVFGIIESIGDDLCKFRVVVDGVKVIGGTAPDDGEVRELVDAEMRYWRDNRTVPCRVLRERRRAGRGL